MSVSLFFRRFRWFPRTWSVRVDPLVDEKKGIGSCNAAARLPQRYNPAPADLTWGLVDNEEISLLGLCEVDVQGSDDILLLSCDRLII